MGAMVTPSASSLGPDAPDELHRVRVVAMHADGVGLDGHLFAGDGRDLALFYHAHGAGNGLVRVVNHRTGLGAGHQAAVGLVGTVGKHLTGHPQPGGPACAQQLAARKPQQDHVLVHRGNALGNAGGQGFVLGGHVVQGAVGLHVLQGHPVGGAEGQQRAHLILHIGLGLGGGAHQIPAGQSPSGRGSRGARPRPRPPLWRRPRFCPSPTGRPHGSRRPR